MLLDEPDDQTFPDAQLQEVANSLLCPICKEYFDCCMLLSSCQHSFCSLCIRRAVEFQRQCPVCKQPAEAPQLVPIRLVDGIVAAFRACAPTLLRLCAVAAQAEASKASSSVQRGRQARNAAPSAICHRPRTRSQTVAVGASSEEEEGAAHDSDFEVGTLSSRTRNAAKRRASQPTVPAISGPPKNKKPKPAAEEPKASDAPLAAQKPPAGHVACPLCNLWVAEYGINLHLDNCLRLKGQPPPASRVSRPAPPLPAPAQQSLSKRERLKAPVFHLMGLKELKALLAGRGLLTRGDRNALARRYKEFVVRHNANLDHLEPVSEKAIVAQLNREEEARAAGPERPLPSMATQGRSAEEQFAALERAAKEQMAKARASQLPPKSAQAPKPMAVEIDDSCHSSSSVPALPGDYGHNSPTRDADVERQTEWPCTAETLSSVQLPASEEPTSPRHIPPRPSALSLPPAFPPTAPASEPVTGPPSDPATRSYWLPEEDDERSPWSPRGEHL